MYSKEQWMHNFKLNLSVMNQRPEQVEGNSI